MRQRSQEHIGALRGGNAHPVGASGSSTQSNWVSYPGCVVLTGMPGSFCGRGRRPPASRKARSYVRKRTGGFQRSSLHGLVLKDSEQVVWRLPIKGLSGPAVELVADALKIVRRVDSEVRALGELVAEQPVGVLIAWSLPGAPRVAEEHRHADCIRDRVMVTHLAALVPGE